MVNHSLRQLFALALFVVITVGVSAQKSVTPSKSSAKTGASVASKPKPANTHTAVIKPNKPVTNSRVSPTQQKPSVQSSKLTTQNSKPTTTHIQSESRPAQKEEIRPFNPEKSTNGTYSMPAPGIDKEAILIKSFMKFRGGNKKNYRKDVRHCGCTGSSITFSNPTDVTLELYVSYLQPMNVPTLDDATMPSFRNTASRPSYIILPHESVVLQSSCSGAYRYEVVSKFDQNDSDGKRMSNNLSDPEFVDTGFVRMSCIDKIVFFENEILNK